jgi:hypothetical protein
MSSLRQSAMNKVFAGETTLKEINKRHSLTKSVLEPVTQLFRPQRPLWAYEFTSRHLIVARVNPRGKDCGQRNLLFPTSVTGSLLKNIVDHGSVPGSDGVDERNGLQGTRNQRYVPDDSARFLYHDKLFPEAKRNARRSFAGS